MASAAITAARASGTDWPSNGPAAAADELARRLADHPLDELQHDGLAVGASIRAGYDALTTAAGPASQLAARAFRALGLLPLPDVAPGLVAALLGEPDLEAVRAGLERGEIGWRDLVDFYARHRCQTYQFPISYRAFSAEGAMRLPVADAGG